jgi:hypothetical protein
MKPITLLIVSLLLVPACTEPDHARSREPAEALQADPAQPFLPDAPSHQVREAIRSAALEVRPDRVLYLAVVMDPEQAAEEEATRPGELVAAHRAFPFHSQLRLTERETGARIDVRVIDGGPFADAQVPTFEPDPRIAVSPDAARQLGVGPGEEAIVWVEILEWAPGRP